MSNTSTDTEVFEKHETVYGPQILWLTDTNGQQILDIEQPERGSVLLVGGESGNAWQRHHKGGRWHSTGGGVRSFSSLMRQRNVVLIYSAEPREEV